MAQLLIAARGGPGAKSRLSPALSPDDRAGLTVVMLQDMLDAATKTPGIGRLWVVTPTAELARIAAAGGARPILQPEPADLNGAFALALAEASEHAPYDVAALLPGDLPLLQPADLEAALALARTHAVVLARTLDGGTGALVLRAGARPPLAFGEDSFASHAAGAEAMGLSVARLEALSLAQDVDGPDDLAAILEIAPNSRTAAFLLERLGSRIRS